jgi:hypothetical protein
MADGVIRYLGVLLISRAGTALQKKFNALKIIASDAAGLPMYHSEIKTLQKNKIWAQNDDSY